MKIVSVISMKIYASLCDSRSICMEMFMKKPKNNSSNYVMSDVKNGENIAKICCFHEKNVLL